MRTALLVLSIGWLCAGGAVEGPARGNCAWPRWPARKHIPGSVARHPVTRPPGSGGTDTPFLVDTSIVPVVLYGSHYDAAAAFDGNNYLVVWHEYGNGMESEIRGARISPAGQLLDSAPLGVNLSPGGQAMPAVAFDGTNYLVVWSDMRIGSTGIYGTRLTPGGVALDPDGFRIIHEDWSPSVSALAFDGVNFLVVSSGYDTLWQPCQLGARVTPGGGLLDSVPITISPGTALSNPTVAFGGEHCLVAWSAPFHDTVEAVYAVRVSRAGAVLDSVAFPVSPRRGHNGAPLAAFDGVNSLVVWASGREMFEDTAIRGARVTPAGQVLDTGGFTVRAASRFQAMPALTFNGRDFLLAWLESDTLRNSELVGARVTPGGVVRDSVPLRFWQPAPPSSRLSLASDGTNVLLGMAFGSVYAERIAPDGAVLDSFEVAVSRTANPQFWSAAAWNGSSYQIVWLDQRSEYLAGVYGARVDPGGTRLDARSFPICTTGTYNGYPTVAAAGTTCLATWTDTREDYGDIYGARITGAGAVLDPEGFVISREFDQQMFSTLASDGTDYLVSWMDFRTDPGYPDVYAARVTGTGALLDSAGIPISIGGYGQGYPSVAFDGENYFIALTRADDDVGDLNIYGARLTRDGVLLDTDLVAVTRQTGTQMVSPVTFDGDNYFLAWLDGGGPESLVIRAARVNPDGALLDSTPTTLGSAGVSIGYFPLLTAAFDGADFLVAWTRFFTSESSYLCGARVSRAGSLIDTFALARGPGSQSFPNLAPGPGGQALLSYTGWAGVVQGRTFNTPRVWAEFGPFGAVAEGRPRAPSPVELTAGPSPFRDRLTIRLAPAFATPQARVGIYNAGGRLVRVLPVDQSAIRSSQSAVLLSWNGTDQSGRQLPNGVYLVRAGDGRNRTATRQVVLRR